MQHINITPDDFFKRAVSAAKHYGFSSFEEALSREYTEEESHQSKQNIVIPKISKRAHPLEQSFHKSLELCAQAELLPRREPILFYTSQTRQTSRGTTDVLFGIHIIGSKQTLAEAIVMKAARAVLESHGIREHHIRVNSVGDKDSSARYIREVTNVLKRCIADLPLTVQTAMRENVLDAIEELITKEHQVVSELPRTVDYLTSPSRRHLKEVLEFMENVELPYVLDEQLLGIRQCLSHIVFELVGTKDRKQVYAAGGRYDDLARTRFRIPTPAVGATIMFETTGQFAKDGMEGRKRRNNAKVCFIHVGIEARMRSFSVIDTFREARIPVEQCFKYDKLTDQLAYAERLNTPYMVIMGQKEAQENVVIVRNTATRAQQTVPLAMLPHFFKQGV